MATSPTPPTSQSGAAADARDAGDSLAERINALFDAHRRPDGRMWTNEEVATALKKAHPLPDEPVRR